MPKFDDVIESPKSFSVKVPKTARKRPRKWIRAVAYGDSHSLFSDPKALGVVKAIIKDVQPDVVVHLGDLLDCYHLSNFDRDPNRLFSIQDEINWGRAHLHEVAQLAPGAERWLLEGNHEDRLKRTIWRLTGAASSLPQLDVFHEAMTWPKLLKLDEIGWEWVPTGLQSKTPILPKVITKHGTTVAKWSGNTAKAEWLKYGKSGMSGHVHRLAEFVHRDHNGSHKWVEAGCTCQLDPEWTSDPDWHQGCVIYTGSETGDWFNLETVYIQDGKGMYRDTLYQAD